MKITVVCFSRAGGILLSTWIVLGFLVVRWAILIIGVLPLLAYLTALAFFYCCTSFELKEKEMKETSTFLGFREKTLQYKNIKQVELKQNLAQQMFDLGTVVVTTQATAQHADIHLFDIKEYKEVYEFLLSNINQSEATESNFAGLIDKIQTKTTIRMPPLWSPEDF